MSEIIYDDVIRTETLETDRGGRVEMMVVIYESLNSTVRNDEVMINTERQQALQHTGRVSVKNRRHRSVQVCLCLLSVLLFTAVIVICVYFTNKTNQLLTQNYNLTKENERLLSELTEEREKFRKKSDELQAVRQAWLSNNFTWIHYNFSFYYISSEIGNWNNSRRDCEQREGSLMIINNKEEQEFVQKATAGYNYWIGLSKEAGAWKWVDGTMLTLSFWVNRYPGSSYNHNCAATDASGWTDYQCNSIYRWICEKRIFKHQDKNLFNNFVTR